MRIRYFILVFILLNSCTSEIEKNNDNIIKYSISENQQLLFDTIAGRVDLHLEGADANSLDTIMKFKYNKRIKIELIKQDFFRMMDKNGILEEVKYLKEKGLLAEFFHDNLTSPKGKGFSGFAREYYPNGNMKKEYFMRDDKLHGSVKKYYTNGRIKDDNYYVNGFKVFWEDFDSLGNVGDSFLKVAFNIDKNINFVGDTVKIQVFNPIPEKYPYHHYKIEAKVVQMKYSNKKREPIEISFEDITVDSINGVGEISFSTNTIGTYAVYGDLLLFSAPDTVHEILRFMYKDGSNEFKFISRPGEL